MSPPLTTIIIDGHPAAFTATIRDQDPTLDRTQMLPPIPWWTCMVDSTLEFCRIGWGTASKELPEISVISAGEQTQHLISFGQAGHVDKLIEGFKHIQPRQTTPQDRIQTALDTLFHNNNNKNNNAQKNSYSRDLRVILLLLSKGNEDRYSYYNNEGVDKRDIRAMLYSSFKDSNLFDSIHVDVLRLFPFTDGLLPSTENTRFAPSATLSMYNIPNRSDTLKITMRHLAQMYYNVDILRISNIPMNVRRQDGSTAMTQTVELYTRCTEPCYSRQHNDPNYQTQQKDTTLPIYDPRFLESKVIQLSYVKRNKRFVNDMGWCICKRLITSLTDDGPTKAYLGTILQGSVSYLIDFNHMDSNKEWTHILIADHDKVLLHIFDHQLENELTEKSQMIIDKSKVKVEDPTMMENTYSSFPMVTPDKVQEFMQMFIHPNMYQDISQLPSTKKFEAFKYSSQEPLLSALSRNNNQTTSNMELTTRWHTCFRDSMGTDMFPVILEDNRPISDFANEVCNGTPLYSGFGLVSTLNLPLNASLNKIKNALFLNDGSQVKIAMAEVDIIVDHLSGVLSGKSTKMLSNVKMIKEDSRLMAKRLLIALYLIGKRFMENGPKKAVCKHIISAINEKTMNIFDGSSNEQLNDNDIDMEQGNTNPNEIAAKEASLAIEAAWNQAKQFEGMTVREQADSRYSLGTGIAVKNEDNMFPTPMNPSTGTMAQSRRGGRGGGGRGRGRGGIHSRGETPERNISVNPNFIRHESGEAGIINRKRQAEQQLQGQGQQKQQPAIPYLLAELTGNKHHGQEEGIVKQDKNTFGPPGSFLDLYWNVDKQLREGKQGDDDGKVLVYRDNKWQRIQKEFDGRIQQQQQQQQQQQKQKQKQNKK